MIAQEYNALSASTLTCMAHVPPEPIVPTALDADQRHALESTLDELDNLLGQGDTAAIALFERHTDAIRAVLGSECEALEQQIRRFGFIQAQNHLRSLRGLHD
jgi:membrane carboxypeptidase/penicillin-binding protein PbpC